MKMWYKFSLGSWEDLENKSNEQLAREMNSEAPMLTDIDDANEIAQYVSVSIKNAMIGYLKSSDKKKLNISDLQNIIKHTANQSIDEVGIFHEELLPQYKNIMKNSIDKTLSFRGLVDYFRANGSPYISSMNRYVNDFWQVFRYIFLKDLLNSNLFEDQKLKYYPYYTKVMKEWSPESQDQLYESI